MNVCYSCSKSHLYYSSRRQLFQESRVSEVSCSEISKLPCGDRRKHPTYVTPMKWDRFCGSVLKSLIALKVSKRIR